MSYNFKLCHQNLGDAMKKRSYKHKKALMFGKHVKDYNLIFLSLRYILMYFES